MPWELSAPATCLGVAAWLCYENVYQACIEIAVSR